MNILMILPYTPTRVRTRPYHLLKALIRAGVRVTLAAVWEEAAEREQLEKWKEEGVKVLSAPLSRGRKLQNLIAALPTRLPLQARFAWQPELAEKIATEVTRNAFDALHVEHLRGAEYGLAAQSHLALRGVRVPVIWDSVDCISLLFGQAAQISRTFFGRWATRFDLQRTRQYEARMVEAFDQTLVTSANDRRALEELAKGKPDHPPIRVLKNGVDLEYFSRGVTPREKNLIVFSGKMSYHANVHAALALVKEIMPIVWKQRPETKVQLVGKDPPDELRREAAAEDRVEVTGTVPHLPVYLQRATMAVTPVMYGVGIQNKVLEAMACATPVVSSQQGVSALQTVDGKDLLTATTPDEFASKIIRLLDSEVIAAHIGENGRKYVESYHNWNDIAKELIQIYAWGRNFSS